MSRPDDNVAGGMRAKLDRLDSYQQRHPVLGVPIAVARKFFEDESINLAAVIAFWAFFSIFPLLLLFVTLLGYVLPPSLQGDVLRSAAPGQKRGSERRRGWSGPLHRSVRSWCAEGSQRAAAASAAGW